MTPQRFRKKPVVIEAWQFTGMHAAATKGSLGVSDLIDWILAGGGTARWHEALPESHGSQRTFSATPEQLAIKTLEGTMYADVGDWIIRGVKGEFYPCKPDIFEQTYEVVE